MVSVSSDIVAGNTLIIKIGLGTTTNTSTLFFVT